MLFSKRSALYVFFALYIPCLDRNSSAGRERPTYSGLSVQRIGNRNCSPRVLGLVKFVSKFAGKRKTVREGAIDDWSCLYAVFFDVGEELRMETELKQ